MVEFPIDKEENMIYAPVLIPTLSRDTHFIRCVESLKRNTWAKNTDVIIALDYPYSPKNWDGYNKICSYLNGEFKEFKSLTVIRRKKNYGAGKNLRSALSDIFKKYDRFIIAEDDIEFSPNFLEYIDKCLYYYQDDPEVVAVCGFSYPIKWDVSNGANCLKINTLCSMWGVGFLTKNYINARNEISNKILLKARKRIFNDGTFSRMLDARQCDYVNYVLGCNESLAYRLCDLSMSIYLAVSKKYVIVPTITKTINHGFDGSGLFSKKRNTGNYGNDSFSYDHDNQELDLDKCFDLKEDQKKDLVSNRNILNAFDRRDARFIRKTKRKLFLIRTFGRWPFLFIEKTKKFIKTRIIKEKNGK